MMTENMAKILYATEQGVKVTDDEGRRIHVNHVEMDIIVVYYRNVFHLPTPVHTKAATTKLFVDGRPYDFWFNDLKISF